MKIVIHPDYHYLKDYLNQLKSFFDKEGKVIYQARNILKVFEVEGVKIVVKSFRKPIFINRIVYSYFRKSKAARSYEHAVQLLNRGVITPHPIGYIECKEEGLLKESFYICLYEDNMRDIRDYMDGTLYDPHLIKDLAHFVASIHNNHIYHLDLSPGNILFNKDCDDSFLFALIDINRLKFKSLSYKERLYNFRRLCLSYSVSSGIAFEYALYNNFPLQNTITEINKYSDHFFIYLACSWAFRDVKREYGWLRAICGPYYFKCLLRLSEVLPVLKKINYIEDRRCSLYKQYIQKLDFREVFERL